MQVVHADMKTKNILLSAGRMTAKIADVGLARYMAQTHMDTASLPLGTFVYAAPELLLGRRSDHKASTQASDPSPHTTSVLLLPQFPCCRVSQSLTCFLGWPARQGPEAMYRSNVTSQSALASSALDEARAHHRPPKSVSLILPVPV